MNKIGKDEVKMRSKSFFLLMKALAEIGLIFLIAALVFFVNLSFYLPKRDFPAQPPMAGELPRVFIGIIPFWHVAFALLLFSFAVWVIYQYTDFYKKHWATFMIIFVLSVLVLGYFLALSPINRHLERQMHFRPLYRPGMMHDRNINMLLPRFRNL